MKIAILSDSHDHYENLLKAIEIANESGCEKLLFAGDLVAPGNGVQTLSIFKNKLHFIYGNNDGEVFGMTKMFSKYENLEIEGNEFETEVDGVKIFMTYYPRIAQIAAHSRLFHLVIYGHDHTYHKEKIGECLLLNPGAIHPYKTDTASFVIYDTSDQSSERILL